MTPTILHKLGLDSNPFEPAATGTPFYGTLTPPINLRPSVFIACHHINFHNLMESIQWRLLLEGQ